MKKNNSGFIVVLIVGAFIIFNAEDWIGSKTNKRPVVSTNDSPTATKPVKSSALWPYMMDSNLNLAVADNLLTTNIYVVFDGSGSMEEKGCSGGQQKIAAAKQALIEFVEAIPSDANVGLLAFDYKGARERLPLAAVNHQQFTDVVEEIRAGGGTPLGEAIKKAYLSLTAQARKQLGYGEYHLLVVTDGQASDAYSLTDNLNKVLKDSPVVVHTIGFCIGKNHSLNQPGKTFYSTAQDYQSLRAGLQSVLAESPDFNVAGFNQ